MPNENPILTAWTTTLAAHGAKTAIFGVEGQPLRTFADLESDAARLTGKLQGLAPGSVVAFQLGADPLFIALLIALWRQNLVPLPLERSLEGEALSEALGTCRAATLLQLAGDPINRSYRPNRTYPVDRVIWKPTGQSTENTRVVPEGTHFLKLTSGTTGKPRGIRFTGAQLLADCTAVCETMGIAEDDLNYGVIPWAHSYGFSNLITPLICRGIPLVATKDRLPRAILDGLQKSRATVFPSVPVLYRKLCEMSDAQLPDLRLCISAGAPLPLDVATKFRKTFGLKIRNFYGSSECGGIAYDATENFELPEGCVGQPMRGVQIVQKEDRAEVHSAAVAEGYFPNEDPDVLGHGRFVPGDLIESTPEGLRIVGRVSDFINIGGRKLNPGEVELRLRNAPGVREVVVFGVANPIRGEEPIACVVSDHRSTDDLLRFCRAELPAWQCPRDIWLVDALPFNERGKLSRAELAKSYLQSRIGA